MVKKSKDMANLFLAAKLVGGSGGGKQPVLVTKSITENGVYSASADNADGYSQVTVDVPAPAPLSPTRSGATIYDYDGSVIATYTPEEFAVLTEYPAHPEHEFLTGDGYNWSLANAQAYSAKYGYVEVGAQYRVTDGKTRLFITLSEGRLEPQLGLGINGSVDVDWGDGSAHDTMTGSDVSTTVYQAHTYAQAGNYIIALTVTGSVRFNGASGYGLILGKSGGDQNTNRVYLNALQSIYVGDGVTSISNYAFSGCYSLASVIISNGVTSIGDSAFRYCYSLTSVTIPISVTSIGNYVFDSCHSLTSVTIPNGVTSIDTSAFGSCYSLTSVTIPNGVTRIGDSAFQKCYSLASVTISSSVTRISNYVFSDCYSLASVIISNGVTSIGDSAFRYCYSLTSVTIPISVTSIGNGAFSGCYGLSYIRIDNFQNGIVGSPWGAPSSDTVVIWSRVARFTSVTNEVSSGKTLTTSISCTVGDLIVATIVIRGNTYDISSDWTLLGISEVVGSGNQRTAMAYKIAENTTESLTVTQDNNGRIYTNLVSITGASIGTFSGFTTQATGGTITMNRPSGLVIWSVSASLWGTSTPYVPWGISNTTDIYAVELPISTQPRCLTALDQSEDSTISFTYSPGTQGDGALACASLTITGIPNFWYQT